MLSYFRVPVGWFEIFRRTAIAAFKDNILGLSAQLAFYFFLSLFPALLFVVALVSFFPLEGVMDAIIIALAQVAPPDVLQIVREQLELISESGDVGLLTVGFLGAIWSSSLAMASIIDTLNRAYGIQDSRPFWKVRLAAIVLTIAMAIFMLVSFFLVMVGPTLAEAFARDVGLGDAFVLSWKILQWPVVFFLVVTAVGLVYYSAPDAEQDWVWITPGSLLATLLWIGSSLGLRFYLANFADYIATYGAIGGVIVLLLWFYLSGFAILIGAELNSEIEHASPYGKDPGERAPGQRKRIGIAARHAYEELLASGRMPTLKAAEFNCDIDRPPSRRARSEEKQSARRTMFRRIALGSLVLGPAALVLRSLFRKSG
jgi:membrane protein